MQPLDEKEDVVDISRLGVGFVAVHVGKVLKTGSKTIKLKLFKLHAVFILQSLLPTGYRAKLQNTRPMYLHTLNNNSVHCNISRSSKASDTWAGYSAIAPFYSHVYRIKLTTYSHIHLLTNILSVYIEAQKCATIKNDLFVLMTIPGLGLHIKNNSKTYVGYVTNFFTLFIS